MPFHGYSSAFSLNYANISGLASRPVSGLVIHY